MTEAEIAELEGKGLLDADQLWAAVDTLLREREALLKALAPILRRIDGDREFACHDCGAEMIVAAHAAIRKATE